MMNLEGLQLETGGATGIGEESWAVSDDGSLRHHRTGIFIGEGGLRDGRTAWFYFSPGTFSEMLEHVGKVHGSQTEC